MKIIGYTLAVLSVLAVNQTGKADVNMDPAAAERRKSVTQLDDGAAIMMRERCYGIVRKNDYEGLTLPENLLNRPHYRPIDGDGYAYIVLPFGICERLKRGALEPFHNDSVEQTDIEKRLEFETDAGEKLESKQDQIERRIQDFLYR